MLSLEKIREDLREIRYYYSRKDKFDEAFKLMPSSVIDIVEKARRYNEAVKTAPVRLCDIYIGLYMKNNTQESLSVELGYGLEYVQRHNKKLLIFLQSKLAEDRF